MALTAEQLAADSAGLALPEAERYLRQWGERYAEVFTVEQALRHREALAVLTPAMPVAVIVSVPADGALACTVLAYDYPALFSLITGYLLFIVTNQSGIARGYFGHQELRKVHDRMEALLAEEGVYLDAIYYSPYWKDGVVVPYNVEHEDRKPGTGMYKRAMADFGFSRKDSWMIGDRATDIAFGQNAGLRTIMLLSGNGRDELEGGIVRSVHAPDYIAQNIYTAARLIELCDKSK